MFVEWWGQTGPSHYHVYKVLPRMQCVWWGLRCWWGMWHGQQHWKRQQLRLFGPNTAWWVSLKVFEDVLHYVSVSVRRSYILLVFVSHVPQKRWKDPIWVRYFIWLLKKSGLFLTTLPFLLYNPSRLIGSAAASVISGEEQFEDYGEGEDVDFTPSSPCPEEDTRTNGFSDLGSSLPSRFVFELEAHALNTILGDTLGTWWS